MKWGKKNLIPVLVAVSIILCCSVGQANILNVPQYYQEQTNWCWAGSSQMVIAYYGTSVAQCTIADWARIQNSWGSDNCCSNPSGSICDQANGYWTPAPLPAGRRGTFWSRPRPGCR